MKYAGIDLHSNNSVVVVTDEADRVCAERHVSSALAQVLGVLQPHRNELAGVVVESTYSGYWLVDGLQDAGFVVHLANTAAMQQYSGLKHGNDHPAARDLARQRMRLVRARSRAIVAVENVLSCRTGGRLSSNQIIKRLGGEDIEALELHTDVRLALQAQVAVIGALAAQIDALENRLQERVHLQPDYRNLLTVPGIGAVLATVIALETRPIERFGAVGHFASYARCVGSALLSNGKKKGRGNVKNGNRYLAWAFVEAAQFARRYCAQAARYYERKREQTNTAVATKALARKLARACYHMRKQGRPFDAARCFG